MHGASRNYRYVWDVSVLDAQVGGYDMDRVFMDGGSSMNIIFVSTLHKMMIP